MEGRGADKSKMLNWMTHHTGTLWCKSELGLNFLIPPPLLDHVLHCHQIDATPMTTEIIAAE
jgi:hypothetical protein